MKPMKGYKFADYRDRISYPVFIQPKLNGVRAVYSETTPPSLYGQFQSYDEKLWHTSKLAHLHSEYHRLRPITSRYIFDGELYLHGLSLQSINGAVSINSSEPTDKTRSIEHHIFDIIDLENPLRPFRERFELLEELRFHLHNRGITQLKVVRTIHAAKVLAESQYARWRAEGYEGAMYRSVNAPYGFLENCTNQENRWGCLIKRKDWQDDEFDVIGYEEGEGKYSGMVGALRCRLPNGGEFTVGSGLSDEQRVAFTERLPSQVKVRYEWLSDGGVPIQPRIELVID